MQYFDIVIIDSGLNQNDDLYISGICVKKTNIGVEVSNDLVDKIGHGSVIYSIIRKYANSSKIFVVKLSDCDDYDESCLISALKFISQNINCRIINISLGIKTGERIKELYDICHDLSEKGIIIVSAFDNEGCYSYPAAFDCVLGVDNKNDLKHITQFDFVENSPVNILAKGNLQRLTLQDGKKIIVGGSSIACAYVTTMLANMLEECVNLQSALMYLKSQSRYIYSSSN